ncbi:MAG: penicillin-binding protein 2, partial [Patescibacteria group bacterium]
SQGLPALTRALALAALGMLGGGNRPPPLFEAVRDLNYRARVETLSDLLLTEEFHAACTDGADSCPHELIPFYAAAFDALTQFTLLHTGALLEPLPTGQLPRSLLSLPDLVEARRLFARDIERRISDKRITFVPLKYGATKVQMAAAASLNIPGLTVATEEKLIWADPEEIQQMRIPSIARALSVVLETDSKRIADLLRSRPLRYVAVMRRLPPALSLLVKETQVANYKAAVAKARGGQGGRRVVEVDYHLRSVALIPEHWRFYPDATVASHVVGFLNASQEPQYGVERTFNAQLRGQEGLISTVSDPQGGQILTAEQTIITPRDGDTLVLTLDRAVQREVEQRLQEAVDQYRADSGQAIVLEPFTGRIIAMANAPLFDGNDYASVYEKVPLTLSPEHRAMVVVEVFQPETNERVVKAYMQDVFTEEGRSRLTEKTRKAIERLEKLYDLRDFTRYYFYVGQNLRMEVFPTGRQDVWLKFKNTIGVGAYLNRTIQEIYEPGSVLKPVTMAIALDQGEVQPGDIYDDTGPVEVDEYKIDNNDRKHYGRVTMTGCLEYSINTCMTSIGFKLGQKLFFRTLERFGFGTITSIELEDELPGELRSWREWSRSLLATTAFGQGLSSTPLQVVTAWAALANGGKLMRPTIIDSIVHADGSYEKTEPRFVDQVIQPKTSETITAMLVSSATKGFAKTGKVKGYRIAGKTGTSQIAGPGGKYETGTGSTFATYAGFAPVDRPRFVILVKIDRPKNVTHGATAAAPVFREIAAFLFNYYGIQPDDPASR